MKIWIIAGESSGDLYGARISKELKDLNPDIEISGMGGLEMKKQGLDRCVRTSPTQFKFLPFHAKPLPFIAVPLADRTSQ